MFREESVWISNVLENITLEKAEVANLGSSTGYFRKVIQPHIHENIVKPLENKSFKVVNIDIKLEEGVDIQADITSADFRKSIGKKFDLVICTNMLEHVENINTSIENILAITEEKGFVLITVPRRYPIHLDPIDNNFRPKPNEIFNYFKNISTAKIVKSSIINIKDINCYPVRKSKFPIWGYRQRVKFWLKYYYQVTGILIKLG